MTADDREPLGRIAFGAHVSGLAEQEQPPWQDKPPVWEELGGGDREFYMRIGSAVAAQAVHDAGLEAEAMKRQLYAFSVHMPAIRRALAVAITESEYEAQAGPYRAALRVLGEP